MDVRAVRARRCVPAALDTELRLIRGEYNTVWLHASMVSVSPDVDRGGPRSASG